MNTVTLPHEPPLILLSGMGADERLFRYPKAAFPNLVVPSWIEADPKERLSDYAERLARLVDPGVPCFVGGHCLASLPTSAHKWPPLVFVSRSRRCLTGHIVRHGVAATGRRPRSDSTPQQ